MFTKLKTLRIPPNGETITLHQLYQLVRNNPDEKIKKIRSMKYKSDEYNEMKLDMVSIMPHGTFKTLGNSGLLRYSGYLYYDVDGIDTLNELNDTIDRVISQFPITFLQRSVSNKGFHFLIRIDDTLLQPTDTSYFYLLYNHVRELLINKGIKVDSGAGGLVRKMIVSSDTNVYLNDTNIMFIDFKDIKSSNKIKIIREEKIESTIPTDTFKEEIIPYGTLLKRLKLETTYDDMVFSDDETYIIENRDYYRILIPRIINDGTKHKLYPRIINALYYINGNKLTRKEIISYIFYVNQTASPRWGYYYLKLFVNNICDLVEKNGVMIKTRVKRLHFNKEYKLTKKQKQSMGAQLSGKIKMSNSIKKICDAKLELSLSGEIPTQKRVQEFTGLGIATVKRYWNKEYVSFDIEVPEDKGHVDNLPTISFEDFMNISDKTLKNPHFSKTSKNDF